MRLSALPVKQPDLRKPYTKPQPPDLKKPYTKKPEPPGPRPRVVFVIQYTQSGSMAGLWKMYREFEYEALIDAVTKDYANRSLSANQRSTAWALAGSSAYLLWRSNDAQAFFGKSIQANPKSQLDKNVFPTDIYRLYEQMKTDH
ncbi:hypothetical protein JYT90_00555 [bacterium AH-315-P07]|nr:hypothetical protein [bacterium AH-315-P07]